MRLEKHHLKGIGPSSILKSKNKQYINIIFDFYVLCLKIETYQLYQLLVLHRLAMNPIDSLWYSNLSPEAALFSYTYYILH